MITAVRMKREFHQAFAQIQAQSFLGDTLKALRLSNVDRIIVAQINVNSIRNKFDALIAGIQNKVDILLISETKLDETFPTRQFSIDGFTSPYRLDRNGFGGGLLAYVREDIPSKFIKTELSNREGFFTEINLRNKKWVIGFLTTRIMQRLVHI